MICKHCGAPLQDTDERCAFCGMSVELDEKTRSERAKLKDEADRRKKLEGLVSMKLTSIGFMIFISIFTLGFYSIYWFWTRTGDLNRLTPKVQLPSWGAVVYLIFYVALLFVQDESVQGMLFLAMFIFYGWLVFSFRKVLRVYAAEHIESSVVNRYIAPSAVMTFLFGALYIQAQINKMIHMELLAVKI